MDMHASLVTAYATVADVHGAEAALADAVAARAAVDSDSDGEGMALMEVPLPRSASEAMVDMYLRLHHGCQLAVEFVEKAHTDWAYVPSQVRSHGIALTEARVCRDASLFT